MVPAMRPIFYRQPWGSRHALLPRSQGLKAATRTARRWKFLPWYVGKMNKLFVERLQQLGVNAVGLCGADGRSMEGERKAAIKVIENGKRKVLRDDFTGRVEKINTALLTLLLDHGYTPVLCPPGLSARVKSSMSMVTVLPPSWPRCSKPRCSLFSRMCPACCGMSTMRTRWSVASIKAHMSSYMDLAQGRMKKKVMGAAEALEQGVGTVILGDARLEHPIQHALQGQGR